MTVTETIIATNRDEERARSADRLASEAQAVVMDHDPAVSPDRGDRLLILGIYGPIVFLAILAAVLAW